MIDRRSVLIGSAMAATGIAGVVLRPVPEGPAVAAGTLSRAIAPTIGDSVAQPSGRFVLPADSPVVRRTYSDTLTRRYVAADGFAVMLLAAAGAADGPGLSVHRPERCYPAVGFDIERSASTPLSPPAPDDARAQLVTAVRDDRRELVHYWVRVGDAFPVDALAQRLALLDANLHGVVPNARLMRLSALSGGAGEDDAVYERIGAFSRALLRSLTPDARVLLLGR